MTGRHTPTQNYYEYPPPPPPPLPRSRMDGIVFWQENCASAPVSFDQVSYSVCGIARDLFYLELIFCVFCSSYSGIGINVIVPEDRALSNWETGASESFAAVSHLLLGPCEGGYPCPQSDFQSLVWRYFVRFPCRCRNFDKTSVACCHFVSLVSLFQGRVANRSLPLSGPFYCGAPRGLECVQSALPLRWGMFHRYLFQNKWIGVGEWLYCVRIISAEKNITSSLGRTGGGGGGFSFLLKQFRIFPWVA